MKKLRIVIAGVLVATLGGATTTLGLDEMPGVEPGDDVTLWLSGPFGRVPGGTLARPAAAEPGTAPLDTFVRRAPLTIDAGDDEAVPSLSVASLSVSSVPVSGEREAQVLSSGDFGFAGPDLAGEAVIIVDLVTVGGRTSQHAWLVDVPERELPADGLLDIPAPDIVAETDGGSASGAPGDGCYLYLCVDVGRPPPVAALATLPIAPGETPTVRLSDRSAIAAWEGSISLLGGTPAAPVSAAHEDIGEPQAVMELTGLEPPTTGEWLLTLKVTFDRERGWLWTSYRLVSE